MQEQKSRIQIIKDLSILPKMQKLIYKFREISGIDKFREISGIEVIIENNKEWKIEITNENQKKFFILFTRSQFDELKSNYNKDSTLLTINGEDGYVITYNHSSCQLKLNNKPTLECRDEGILILDNDYKNNIHFDDILISFKEISFKEISFKEFHLKTDMYYYKIILLIVIILILIVLFCYYWFFKEFDIVKS